MSGCIAYVNEKGRWKKCRNEALYPAGKAQYCESHWVNLVNNTMPIYGFASDDTGLKNPREVCTDTFQVWFCDNYMTPRSPVSPRLGAPSPVTPRLGPSSPRYVAPNPYSPSSPRYVARTPVYRGVPGSPTSSAAPGVPGTPGVPSGSGGSPVKAPCVTRTGHECKDEPVDPDDRITKDEGIKSEPRLVRSPPDIERECNVPTIKITSTAVRWMQNIDISKDIESVFNDLNSLRIDIAKQNPDYNYNIIETVADQIATRFAEYMYNPDRIELTLSYMFDYESRDLTRKLLYYGFKTAPVRVGRGTTDIDFINNTLIQLYNSNADSKYKVFTVPAYKLANASSMASSSRARDGGSGSRFAVAEDKNVNTSGETVRQKLQKVIEDIENMDCKGNDKDDKQAEQEKNIGAIEKFINDVSKQSVLDAIYNERRSPNEVKNLVNLGKENKYCITTTSAPVTASTAKGATSAKPAGGNAIIKLDIAANQSVQEWINKLNSRSEKTDKRIVNLLKIFSKVSSPGTKTVTFPSEDNLPKSLALDKNNDIINRLNDSQVTGALTEDKIYKFLPKLGVNK